MPFETEAFSTDRFPKQTQSFTLLRLNCALQEVWQKFLICITTCVAKIPVYEMSRVQGRSFFHSSLFTCKTLVYIFWDVLLSNYFLAFRHLQEVGKDATLSYL